MAVISLGSEPGCVASMLAILGLEVEMEDEWRTSTSKRRLAIPSPHKHRGRRVERHSIAKMVAVLSNVLEADTKMKS